MAQRIPSSLFGDDDAFVGRGIDGELHTKELHSLLEYAEAVAKSTGTNYSDDDKKGVERFIRSQQPTGDLVASSLDAVSETSEDAQQEFFWYAHKVMDADGLQDEAEVKMILEISEALSTTD